MELLVRYLTFAREYYSRDGQPTSEYVEMQSVSKRLEKLYGSMNVVEFGPLSLKSVRQTLIDEQHSRVWINRQINRIRRIFKWGVENEIVPAEFLQALQAVAPLKKGRSAAREMPPVKPVPEEHVTAVLPYVSPQVAAMIRLQLLTGIRPGEVVLMRPIDIDRTDSVWVYRPSRHKTDYRGQIREVFLGPQCQEILRPFLDRHAASFCFSPQEAEEARNSARRQSRKTPLTPSQLKRMPKNNWNAYANDTLVPAFGIELSRFYRPSECSVGEVNGISLIARRCSARFLRGGWRVLEYVLGFGRVFSGGFSIHLNLDLSAKHDTRHC